jgi:hypothetical protein
LTKKVLLSYARELMGATDAISLQLGFKPRSLIGIIRRAYSQPPDLTMITENQNDILTRTGPGTLMGDLFRRYWLPRCAGSCPRTLRAGAREAAGQP